MSKSQSKNLKSVKSTKSAKSAKSVKSTKSAKSKKSPKSTKFFQVLHHIYHILLLALPPVLYFSYYPLIHFGQTDSMNLEISLPLIWLVIFDLVGLIILYESRPRLNFHQIWPWLLLPFFLTVSVVWSLNPLRGVLTVGVVWLIYFAIFCFFILRKIIPWPRNFTQLFWRVFFISSLLVCAWCWLQAILDLAGLSQTHTLMCNGCIYAMFGFPRPNGFAIEPQFMGNLLLAPTLLAAWFAGSDQPHHKKYYLIFFILAATLFLTFSRGAIYAFAAGILLLVIWRIIQTKSPRPLLQVLVFILAFTFTLNAQGIMAAASPTSDTYASGIAKTIHQLSLGRIDFRSAVVQTEKARTNNPQTNNAQTNNTQTNNTQTNNSQSQTIQPEKITSNSPDTIIESDTAIFDGYVAESTDTRVRLTNSALSIWSTNLNLILFGVGLGGAGQALYLSNLSPAPKEIVQNEYASLLLETGLLGFILVLFTLYLFLRLVNHSSLRLPLFALILAYAITLFFFSGLPNALQIYLIPPLILLFSDERSSSHRSRLRAAGKIPAHFRARSRK